MSDRPDWRWALLGNWLHSYLSAQPTWRWKALSVCCWWLCWFLCACSLRKRYQPLQNLYWGLARKLLARGIGSVEHFPAYCKDWGRFLHKLSVYCLLFFCIQFGFKAYNDIKGQFFGFGVSGGNSTDTDVCGLSCCMENKNAIVTAFKTNCQRTNRLAFCNVFGTCVRRHYQLWLIVWGEAPGGYSRVHSTYIHKALLWTWWYSYRLLLRSRQFSLLSCPSLHLYSALLRKMAYLLAPWSPPMVCTAT